MRKLTLAILGLVSSALAACSTPAPVVTPGPTPAPTTTFEAAQSDALSISYDELFRHNEQYLGKTVTFRGKVVQVSEQRGDEYLLRVNVTETEFGSWTDDVRLDYEGPRLLEKDLAGC